MFRRAAVCAATWMLSTPFAAAAPCDGLGGKELLACLEGAYPTHHSSVEAQCANEGKGAARWACRRDRYSELGITIDPPVLREAAAPPPAAEQDLGKAVASFMTTAMSVCRSHEPVPLAVHLWVSNPQEVATAQKGAGMVAIGNVSASMGLTDSVESKVYDGIVVKAQASFASKGIDATVTQSLRAVKTSTVHTWSKGSASVLSIKPGNYRLISITIADAIGLACEEKGDLVGVAVATGASGLIEGKVKEKVERKVIRELAANGVVAYVIGPP